MLLTGTDSITIHIYFLNKKKKRNNILHLSSIHLLIQEFVITLVDIYYIYVFISMFIYY